jgi:DNA-binding XRE family transcriptional regulator
MPKTWNDIEKNMQALSSEELAEIDLKVEIVGMIIEARKKEQISQRELEQLSGVPQAVIARFETNSTNPRLTTLLRILRPLGYKLAIVPIEGD